MHPKSPIPLKRRIALINLFLFTIFALTGYVEYFFRHAPPERSLSMGVAFTVILLLYLFLLQHRKKRKN